MSATVRRLAAALTLIGFAAASISAADEVELKHHFKPGTTRIVEMTESATQIMSGALAGEGGMKSDSGSVYTFEEKVLDAGADANRVQTTFQRVMLKLAHPMAGSHAFDSDSGEKPDDANSMSLIAAPWVGKSL